MAGNKVYVQGHYVDVHDNEVVNISIDKVGTIQVGEANVAVAQEEAVPALLDTPRAHELWQKAQAEGWVDEARQPTGLSRPDAALLAYRIGQVLGIEGWKPFEILWHRQNMRVDYSKTQHNQKTDDFEKELKRKIK